MTGGFPSQSASNVEMSWRHDGYQLSGVARSAILPCNDNQVKGQTIEKYCSSGPFITWILMRVRCLRSHFLVPGYSFKQLKVHFFGKNSSVNGLFFLLQSKARCLYIKEKFIKKIGILVQNSWLYLKKKSLTKIIFGLKLVKIHSRTGYW